MSYVKHPWVLTGDTMVVLYANDHNVFFSLVDKFVSFLEAGPLNHDISKVREGRDISFQPLGWYIYMYIT